MATIKINHAYTIADKILKAKIDELLAELESKYPISFRWESDCCVKVKRTGAKGEIVFKDGHLSLAIKLGLIFAAFKSSVEKDIKRFLQENVG